MIDPASLRFDGGSPDAEGKNGTQIQIYQNGNEDVWSGDTTLAVGSVEQCGKACNHSGLVNGDAFISGQRLDARETTRKLCDLFNGRHPLKTVSWQHARASVKYAL